MSLGSCQTDTFAAVLEGVQWISGGKGCQIGPNSPFPHHTSSSLSDDQGQSSEPPSCVKTHQYLELRRLALEPGPLLGLPMACAICGSLNRLLQEGSMQRAVIGLES
ncbi:hypothetical protein SRHO_G00094370 [Serrasalmus rhombeus]